jgi:hypothetical protein
MQDHVKIIGILWIILGSLNLFGTMILFFVLFGVSFIPDMGPVAPGIIRFVATLFGSFLAVLAIPKILGGIGLLKRQEWARILMIVLSFLSLLSVPFGTALGIYSIVILLNKEAIKLFQPGAGTTSK